MEIKIDDKVILNISDADMLLLGSDLIEDVQQEIERRLSWVITSKLDRCFKRLKDEWDVKLAASGVDMVPTARDAYINLVCNHADYKSAAQKNADASKHIKQAMAQANPSAQ